MQLVVFSAHAEVVPAEQVKQMFDDGILRARGGSSPSVPVFAKVALYSPRTRR